MRSEHLTAEKILLSAEDQLRRFGPEKTTLSDVARALGVSHAAIYRHFAGKDALRAAVAERWLARYSAPLQPIVEDLGQNALTRLEAWLRVMFREKRRKALEDPEIFATYRRLLDTDAGALDAHHVTLKRQLRALLEQGAAAGEVACADIEQTARAIWSATARFRSPKFAGEWSCAEADADLEAVIALIHAALTPNPT